MKRYQSFPRITRVQAHTRVIGRVHPTMAFFRKNPPPSKIAKAWEGAKKVVRKAKKALGYGTVGVANKARESASHGVQEFNNHLARHGNLRQAFRHGVHQALRHHNFDLDDVKHDAKKIKENIQKLGHKVKRFKTSQKLINHAKNAK